VCVRACVYVYVCLHDVCVYVYVCMNVCVHVYVCMCMHIYMCVHVYVRACTVSETISETITYKFGSKVLR
jgi:hypothetical protein